MPKQYINPEGYYKTENYSHAVKVGNTIYIAGVVGVDDKGRTFGDGSIVTQVDKAYENLKLVLAAAGATMEDLVSTRVYLTRARDFEVYKATRMKHMKKPNPGLTVLIVKALGRADLLFEMEAIAVIG